MELNNIKSDDEVNEDKKLKIKNLMDTDEH